MIGRRKFFIRVISGIDIFFGFHYFSLRILMGFPCLLFDLDHPFVLIESANISGYLFYPECLPALCNSCFVILTITFLSLLDCCRLPKNCVGCILFSASSNPEILGGHPLHYTCSFYMDIKLRRSGDFVIAHSQNLRGYTPPVSPCLIHLII
ncbi:hypothetical protein PRUPE_2G068600 [Prunus persica]|uniref:Uncharacterized protein n=1 Tax=Prunus persica TaxID=3760 RepID=A0A251QFN3_PRUPE|nr:hypothetical protein PRUPE_2G068600 [Prunus persica]